MRRRQQSLLQSGLRTGDFHLKWRRAWRRITGQRGILVLILMLLVIALAPPLSFHFRLTRLQKMQMKNCGWMRNPPLVCAHGGDSVNAFPNTMAAYRSALRSGADCIEIDVSRSADGILFALHDRQGVAADFWESYIQSWLLEYERSASHHPDWRIMGCILIVTYMINGLDAALHFPKVIDDQKVPTLEDALRLVSHSVRQVILDAKVGPPSYEKGLAENILATVKKTHCTNCIIWAKSDTLVREIIRISSNTMVGYIIMKDPQTRSRSNLLRLKKAGIAGIYHPLIDEQLIQILRRGNKKIYAWTVDDLNSMQHMLVNSVDAVVTSNPALLQQLMQNTRIQCLEDGFSLP